MNRSSSTRRPGAGRVGGLSLLLLMLAASGGLASVGGAAAPTVQTPQLGYGWALLKMLGALVVVCVAAYLLLRFGLRRIAAPRVGQGVVRVLERCPLAAGRSLLVVTVGERYFLLGETEGGITKLAELDRQQVEASRAQRPSRPFWELIGRRQRGCQSDGDAGAGAETGGGDG